MIWIILILAFILMAIGLPVAITIASVSLIYILFSGIPINIVSQQLISGVNVTALLAIPLFILAGDIMGKGGLATRMIRLASSIVGRVSGGLGIVAIIGCLFFSAISGSGVATAATIGSLMIPAMVQKGYDRNFATSIVATGSPLGVILPPSISFIIYSSLTGASVADLYRAGLSAGILVGIALIILFYFLSKRQGISSDSSPFSIKELWNSFKNSVWALVTPIILIGGVFGGIFTPTESAAVAVFYALFVGIFIYRDLKIKDLFSIFLSSAKMTANVMFLIATATLLAWVLTAEGIPQQMVQTLLALSDNPIIIILVIIGLILLIGLFMETAAVLIILVPLFLPVVTSLGMDPVHFGIVVTVGTAIGLVTPPFGMCLFTAASVGGANIEKVSRQAFIPILVMILILLVITFIPSTVMFLID
ncbi:TRAP transporter large permease [Alkalihalobacillus sp. 1P02AB]|uniref:TRAP transporter large permease n=1 Tax=Alkalihalobacillus sp. 1P02AB TaxID=3132260 RepID=UPI0039A5CD56